MNCGNTNENVYVTIAVNRNLSNCEKARKRGISGLQRDSNPTNVTAVLHHLRLDSDTQPAEKTTVNRLLKAKRDYDFCQNSAKMITRFPCSYTKCSYHIKRKIPSEF